MKKVLFATSALVATASVAAADISFSGYGRFGLQYLEDRDIVQANPNVDDTIIESRFRINIDASTETDGGVEFGARLRIEANENNDGTAGVGGFNAARFHVATGGFRLEVGNVAHATDNLANYYGYEPGLTAPVGQYSNHAGPVQGYSGTGNGVNGVSAIYTVGDFRAQVTFDSDTDGAGTANQEGVSVSVAYTFSGWTVALAHESRDDGAGAATSDVDGTVLTVGGTIGAADVAFLVADSSVEGTSYGMSGKFAVGAATSIVASISAGGDDVTTTKDTAYGIGFDHSLGGGVNLRGMVGRNNADRTVADLGVVFNF